MSYDAPFAGLKVVDLSQGIAGPYCAMLLAQHGADVIKVEGIGDGDWARTLGIALRQPLGLLDHRQSRQAQHRRRSQDRGRQAGRVAAAEGRRRLPRRLPAGRHQAAGLRLRGRRRRASRASSIVSISGFGQTGPLAERPAMDPVLQAYTGLMSENRGEDGIPHRVPVIVVDMSTGALCLPGAVGRALCPPRRDARPLHRCQPDAGRDGAAVDPPDGLPSRGRHDEARRRAGRRVPDRRRLDVDPGLQRPRLAQPLPGDGHAGAGRRSALRHAGGCGSPTTWRSTPSCGPAIAARPSAEWSQRLTEARLMHERLNSYADFLDQPHVQARPA